MVKKPALWRLPSYSRPGLPRPAITNSILPLAGVELAEMRSNTSKILIRSLLIEQLSTNYTISCPGMQLPGIKKRRDGAQNEKTLFTDYPLKKSVKNVSRRRKSAPSIRISGCGRHYPKYPYIHLLLWEEFSTCKLSEAEFRRSNIL